MAVRAVSVADFVRLGKTDREQIRRPVGLAELPFGVPVEVEFLFEVS